MKLDRAIGAAATLVVLGIAGCQAEKYSELDYLTETAIVSGPLDDSVPRGEGATFVSYESWQKMNAERLAQEQSAAAAIAEVNPSTWGSAFASASSPLSRWPQVPDKVGLEICNGSIEKLDVAIGFWDQATSTWTSSGWWALEQAQCEIVYGQSTAGQNFYVTATGSNGSKWGSGFSFCVQADAFVINGGTDCPSRNYRSADFSETRVPAGEHFWKYEFTGGQPSKIERLDVGDGVYVQGFFSDELVYIARIDYERDEVKVRRATDGTTKWVPVRDIITREDRDANNLVRAGIGIAVIVCGISPESCQPAQ